LVTKVDACDFGFCGGCDDVFIVEHITWRGALVLIDADGLLVRMNHPEARDLASGCTRYAASVSIRRIMSLAWYLRVASGLVER